MADGFDYNIIITDKNRGKITMTISICITFILLAFTTLVIYAQQSQRNTTKIPDDATVLLDLDYVTNAHERQRLDLYLPSGDNLPLVIWIHGGAWLMGSKDDMVPLSLLSKGYAIASINYRLSTHAIFPAQIEDCKSAIRWLRANADKYRLDPNRFGVMGASAGGHLAVMVGTTGDVKEFDVGENLNYSSKVQCVVDLFGPTDFIQMDDYRLRDGQIHNLPDSPESLLVGGNIQENKDKVAKANPITYITKDAPPFLIIHGDSDPLVPHHQSILLEQALSNVGVPVKFHTVKNGGHGGFNNNEINPLIGDFFAKAFSVVEIK